MDVIGEDEDFGDFQDTTTDSSPSINGENGEQQQIEGNSISESDSEECSEYETDFAKRLKMQQKQVLNKDGTKKKKKTEDFSKQLQKHRNDLVNTWEEDHQHHQQQNIPAGSSPDDSEFGTFEDAKQFPAATDNNVESFDTAEMEQLFDAEVSGNGTNGNRGPENTNNTGSDVNLSLDIPDVSGDDLLSALDDELKNIEAEEEENNCGVNLAAEDYENLMNGCLTSPGKITKIEDGGGNSDDYGDLVQSGTDELMAYVDKIGESSTSNKEDSTEPLAAQPQDSNPKAEDDEPATSEPQPPPSDRNDNADNAAETQEGETINTIEDDGFGDYGSTSQPTGGASELTDSVAPNDDGNMVMPTISSVNTSDDAAGDPFNGMGVHDAPMKPLDQSEASDVGGTSSLLDAAAAASTVGAGDENLFAPTTDAGISNNNTQEIDKSEISEADAVPADDKDEFGVFDTAPATETETTTDAVNNNDFGDFDTAPPSDSLDPADVNHEFGEFDTAPATETETETNADAGNDNDFGDFDAAPPSSDSPDPADVNHDFGVFDTAPATETETTDAGNDNDFGGFDAASSSDAPDPTSAADDDDRGDFNNGPASKPAEKAPDDDNDFGDFGAAPPLADPLATTDNDDFGDFDNALAAETTTDAVNDNAVTDNDFGDFGAASASENPPATTDNDDFGDFDNAAAVETTTDAVNDDDFGDFDAAPSSSAPPASPENDDFGGFDNAAVAETTTDAVNDDDFGDFDAAPSSAAPPASPENDDFGGFDNAPAAETTTDAVDDDDFGDFDAAPPSADPPESTDDDDFGDFGNAPVAMKTTDAISDNDFGNFDAAPTRSTPESTDDDDWGDFDDAPAATPVAEESDGNNKDNDFGNFDAAPPAAAPAANTDDDDWGDFDDAPAAPAATPTATAAPVSARPTSADDNDDFGDFDNAPAATVAATPQFEPPTTAGNEEFGDFGTPPSAPSTKHERAPPIDGPELQKARAVFAPMQSKYGFDDLNNDAMEQNLTEELAKANIQSFLAEQEKNKNDLPARVKNESSSSYKLLKELLSSRPKPETQPATTTAASKFIVKNDGRGSYYHFAYPIGGLRPPRQEDAASRGKMGEIRRDQNSTSSPSSPSSKKVPVVLSIELPTGNEVPLSVSSPKKSTPKKIKLTQESLKRNDAPLIPTLHGGGNMQNGGRPVNATTTATIQSSKRSDAAEQLARKIPDLNFMLQSKLVLPQKK